MVNMSRDKLDAALNNNLSICVLIGIPGSDPDKVHTCMDRKTWGNKPWQRWFIVTNPAKLTPAERQLWFPSASTNYVFLGRNTKAVVSSGSVSSDLRLNNKCDYIAFKQKFAQADAQ